MSITTHQRPGVYSAYDASALIRGSGSGGVVGLAAVGTAEQAGQVWQVTTYEQAASLFGADSVMTVLAALVLRNGARAVVCTAAEDAAGYEEAFERLCQRDDVSVMICGSTDIAMQQTSG